MLLKHRPNVAIVVRREIKTRPVRVARRLSRSLRRAPGLAFRIGDVQLEDLHLRQVTHLNQSPNEVMPGLVRKCPFERCTLLPQGFDPMVKVVPAQRRAPNGPQSYVLADFAFHLHGNNLRNAVREFIATSATASFGVETITKVQPKPTEVCQGCPGRSA